MIYLDHAAATKPLPKAIAALINTPQGNPNSTHAAGEAARASLGEALATIVRCIGARSGDIHLFPTATAAAQTAIYSCYAAGYAGQRNATEHHSILERTYIQRFVMQNTAATGRFFIAQMLANNETGEIYGKPELCKGDLWLCDATAALGHIPVDVEQLGCDYLVGDALKFGGVPGAAFLYVRPGAPFFPLIEGGTPPVALACAMAAALKWHTEHMDENRARIELLRETMISSLLAQMDILRVNSWIINISPEAEEKSLLLPHILNVSFDGVDGKALALMLSKRGVMVSAGAACTSGNNEPSHVLMAMYGDENRTRSAIRISLSHENTAEECEQAAKIIAECVQTLREIG